MRKPGTSHGLKWLWLTILVIVADQITKYYAVKKLIFLQPKAIFPGLNFTLAHNYGAAFSFLDLPSIWVSWFFIGLAVIVSLGILIWLARLPATERITAIGLSLILGGAVGNLINRICLGYVVDFIDVYYKTWHWPAFNIADSAICIGAILLLFGCQRR